MESWFTKGPNGERGAATFETVVTLPILVFLLLGGLVLGYHLYLKVGLTYHVWNQSEQYAARPTLVTLVADGLELADPSIPVGLRANRYHGFSLGLPVPKQPMAISAGCYSIPMGLPRLLAGKTATASPKAPAPAADSSLLSRFRSLLETANQYMDGLQNHLDRAEEIVDNVDLSVQVVSQLASEREASKLQSVRLLGSWAVEGGLDWTCGQDGPWVVTAKAVAWSEQTKGLR